MDKIFMVSIRKIILFYAKKIPAFILIMHFSSFAQVLSYDNYRKFEYPGKNWVNLNGKVKLVKLKTFEAFLDSGKIKQGKEKSANYFNERGYFQFDPQGRLLVEAGIWNGDTLAPKTTYSYDLKKKNVSVKETGKDRIIFRQTYIYDHAKQLLTIYENYDQTPEVNKTFKMHYGKDSILDSVIQYTCKGEITEIARFIKNKNKQIISDESFISGINSFIKREYHFSEKGHAIKEINYRLKNLEYNAERSYDSNGNTLSEIMTYSSGLVNKFRYEYEYDKNLNWVKRILFVNNKPSEINVREISYY
jgi:hypothetical protein